jgi:hypothetical protein
VLLLDGADVKAFTEIFAFRRGDRTDALTDLLKAMAASSNDFLCAKGDSNLVLTTILVFAYDLPVIGRAALS